MRDLVPTALLLAFGAAGGDARAEPNAAPVARVFTGAVITERMQIIDADLAEGRVAVRVEYRQSEPGELRCHYAGLSSENLGVRLYLLEVASAARPQVWEVYRSPGGGDTACTTDAEASAALAAAKAAMTAAGLDPSVRRELVPATGGQGEPRDTRRPAESRRAVDLGDGPSLDVRLTHDSDRGFHTYTATVSAGGRALWSHTHAPDPSMAGAGDLEVAGVLHEGRKVLVVLEESAGPVATFDHWVFSPVLEL